MTKARSEQIDLDSTPFYHCYVRCVRRAFLCGDDRSTGENFDHRKQWIVSRLKFLSYVYAIDICAYAVMSNHYNVVLHVDRERANSWSLREVAERWMQLYKGNLLVDEWLENPEAINKAKLKVVTDLIEVWRERLYSLEWFMRGVNETIARMANEEENCKGRFWEGRYKSQALLDDAALLSCIAYVDLNPVRAGIANDLETSDFTSIQHRIAQYANKLHDKNGSSKNKTTNAEPTIESKKTSTAEKRIKAQHKIEQELHLNNIAKAELKPFDGSSHTEIRTALPFTLKDYFDLVDSTGRQLREDKKGFVDGRIPKLITQLNINPDEWISHIKKFGLQYANSVGSAQSLANNAKRLSCRWLKGVGVSRRLYNEIAA